MLSTHDSDRIAGSIVAACDSTAFDLGSIAALPVAAVSIVLFSS